MLQLATELPRRRWLGWKLLRRIVKLPLWGTMKANAGQTGFPLRATPCRPLPREWTHSSRSTRAGKDSTLGLCASCPGRHCRRPGSGLLDRRSADDLPAVAERRGDGRGRTDDVVGAADASPRWQESWRPGTGVALLGPEAGHEVAWICLLWTRQAGSPGGARVGTIRARAGRGRSAQSGKQGGSDAAVSRKAAADSESCGDFMEIDLLRGGETLPRSVSRTVRGRLFHLRRRTTGRRNEEAIRCRCGAVAVVGLPIGPPRPDSPLDSADAFRSPPT